MARGGVDIGKYGETLKYAERAIGAYEELGDDPRKAVAYSLMGTAFLGLGQPADATEAGTKALTLLNSSKDLATKNEVLLTLGMSLFAGGNYVRAIEYFDQAGELAGSRRSAEDVITSFLGSGDCYLQLRQIDKAAQCARLSALLCKKHFNIRGLLASFMLQASVCFFELDKEGLSQLREDATLIARRFSNPQMENVVIQHIAFLENFLNGTVSTEEELTRAVQLRGPQAPPQMVLPFLVQKARAAAAEGNFESAEQQMAEAVAVARSSASPKDLRMTLLMQAEVYRARQQFSAVENLLREALNLNEQIRSMLGDEDSHKITLGQRFLPEYGFLEEALVAQNKMTEALETVERGKARAFADLIERRLGVEQRSEQPISFPELSEYARGICATVVEYSLIVKPAGLVALSKVNIDLLIYVVKPDGALESRRVPMEPIDLGAQQADNDPVTGLDLPSLNLRDLNFSNGGCGGIEDAQWLSEVLIQPITDLLPDSSAETLIFVPNQSFLSVPFAGLPHPAKPGTLVEHHAIMVAPSIQVLARIRKRKQLRPFTPTGVFVAGNPDGSLPHAEEEAREIAKMFQTTALIGAEVTKERVLEEMPHHRILHFATHGELGDPAGDGLAGAIMLAPSHAGPVSLRADEIMNLDLNADLVVLSACSTGRGKETSDGIIGLSRSLLGAGAATVLVALWPVPDYPTRVLMTAFYQEYLKNGDKAEALRQGMLAAMKVDPDPLSWAAFTLIGERY